MKEKGGSWTPETEVREQAQGAQNDVDADAAVSDAGGALGSVLGGVASYGVERARRMDRYACKI